MLRIELFGNSHCLLLLTEMVMNFLGDRYIHLYVDVKDVGARFEK